MLWFYAQHLYMGPPMKNLPNKEKKTRRSHVIPHSFSINKILKFMNLKKRRPHGTGFANSGVAQQPVLHDPQRRRQRILSPSPRGDGTRCRKRRPRWHGNLSWPPPATPAPPRKGVAPRNPRPAPPSTCPHSPGGALSGATFFICPRWIAPQARSMPGRVGVRYPAGSGRGRR